MEEIVRGLATKNQKVVDDNRLLQLELRRTRFDNKGHKQTEGSHVTRSDWKVVCKSAGKTE